MTSVMPPQPRTPSHWFAAIWLAYVAFVFLEPYMSRAPAWEWVFAAATIGVFLPLYFGAFANATRNPRRALMMAIAMVVLGLLMIPLNIGGSTYVIFSAAVAGFVFPRRRDTIVYVLFLGALLLAAVLLTRQFEYWMLFQPALVIMVGLGNIMAAEDRRRNAVLRRAHEDVEEIATLAERERIARDLHDVLGHTLSVIALKSELASKLADIDPVRAAQEIREVERVSREALSEVRAAVEGYRGQGLRGELQRAEQALAAAGVSLSTDVAAVSLPAKQETALVLAVREAITNVVRHANAKTCRISLKEQAGTIVLRIEDDGVGGVPREGNGLTGMRERVAAIGGALTVSSVRLQPDPSALQPHLGGFTLTVTL
jgi:two-component system sensor histidine kinase DesK